MNEWIGLIMILIGLCFNLFGCIGLIRLPDIYNRLQAATKCVTFGTGMILFGIFVIKGISAVGIKALICAIFVLITSPTAAHAIARGSLKYGIKLWDKSVCNQYPDSSVRKKEE